MCGGVGWVGGGEVRKGVFGVCVCVCMCILTPIHSAYVSMITQCRSKCG